MLSSTADHLFWMARNIERAENTARTLDVTYNMSLLKQGNADPTQGWSAMLNISGLFTDYNERYGDISADKVLFFMTLDDENQSSIYCSLQAARENARKVRGTITSEMWEAINATWIELQSIKQCGLPADGMASFCEWVKERSHLSRGITVGTMLHDDAFSFIRLGTFFERADNTARILDVKYHILLPSPAEVGGAGDYYQWGALLRSVSGFETYRKVYSDVITPRRVAELLILRGDMPRSLRHCISDVNRNVQIINGPRATELVRQSGLLNAALKYARIDDIINQGLHEYLTGFLSRVHSVGDLINTTYFWPSDDLA